jgi:hypothetical protein
LAAGHLICHPGADQATKVLPEIRIFLFLRRMIESVILPENKRLGETDCISQTLKELATRGKHCYDSEKIFEDDQMRDQLS